MILAGKNFNTFIINMVLEKHSPDFGAFISGIDLKIIPSEEIKN